ncbi:hypothetical protein BG846_04422 [Streptomyces fradiae ATCC 10745 = DSM 40063]|uniref:Uncharacterized protein n=1 Tax=Streptomyces fradiae ATCC 10745 = DSM 40063 TaxID=1319510 RepID=A0A1Y2NR66_STRFR|nr:hypothetical protein BG846_04422 [Streptomyces fradiae ATCC 10745 = DSM 40063]
MPEARAARLGSVPPGAARLRAVPPGFAPFGRRARARSWGGARTREAAAPGGGGLVPVRGGLAAGAYGKVSLKPLM